MKKLVVTTMLGTLVFFVSSSYGSLPGTLPYNWNQEYTPDANTWGLYHFTQGSSVSTLYSATGSHNLWNNYVSDGAWLTDGGPTGAGWPSPNPTYDFPGSSYRYFSHGYGDGNSLYSIDSMMIEFWVYFDTENFGPTNGEGYNGPTGTSQALFQIFNRVDGSLPANQQDTVNIWAYYGWANGIYVTKTIGNDVASWAADNPDGKTYISKNWFGPEQWHHLAILIDSTDGTGVYWDGNLVFSDSSSTGTLAGFSGQQGQLQLVVGGEDNNYFGYGPIDGKLDEFRIYDGIIPEPMTIGLMLLGLVGLIRRRR